MYSDDLLLLSASVIQLQEILNVWEVVAKVLDVSFNSAKSKCLVIGSNTGLKPEPMLLKNTAVEWVEKLNYLGITLKAGKSFEVDISHVRRKFFISVNTILSKTRFVQDLTRLKLIKTHCLPILLYAVESRPRALTNDPLRQLNACWNSVYRRIFNFQRWESVKELNYVLERLDFYHIVKLKRVLFVKRCLDLYRHNNLMVFKCIDIPLILFDSHCSVLQRRLLTV